MTLSREQAKRDRINLGRLVNRLENALSEDCWSQEDYSDNELAWITARSMAQKIKYARKLLLSVDYHQELNSSGLPSKSSRREFLENMRDTLDRLDKIVDRINQSAPPPEPNTPSSYLNLVSIPFEDEEPHDSMAESSMPAETATSDIPGARPLHSSKAVGATQDLLSSPDTLLPPPSQPQGASSLLSTSFQTHKELSDELSRMASQLKRNAQHFSDSLEKDKATILSASEALERNHDVLSRQRVRLKTYSGTSSSTSCMVFGALIIVSIAWMFMFFVIRAT